jgi:glycosyltransferase involved in cell wall biosynthesis
MIGGAERQMSFVLRHLRKDLFEVKLCLFECMGELLGDIPSEIEIFDLGKKNRWSFGRLIHKLSKLIRNVQPDVVYSRVQYANSISALALRGSGMKHIRHVMNEETILSQSLSERQIGKIMKLWVSRIYPMASYVVAPCEAARQDLVTEFGIPEAKTGVIFNSVDVRSIENLDVRRPPLKGLLNNGGPVITSVGRLGRVKGHRFLLMAFSEVLKYHPTSRLIIVGEGPERAELEKLAAELEITGKVDFTGHQVPYGILANSTVFVLPSLREGIPAALLEAMVLGVPVVASNVGGVPEIIEDEKSGFLVGPSDCEALSTRILTLLHHEGKRHDFIKSAAAAVRERFDIQKNVRRLEGLFLDAVQG